MKIEYIETFLEIVASGNFNRAAERLNLTQSTVSARVKRMEEQFGRALFVRGHYGADLTSAGQRFLRYALGMQRLWRQSQQEITLPEGFDAVLAIGAQISLWDNIVLEWLPRIRTELPGVALRVEADWSANLMRQLSDGLLDIGVMYAPRQVSGLVIEQLIEERLVLVSTTPREVDVWDAGYVYVDWGEAFRAQHSDAFPDTVTPAVSMGVGALALRYILQEGGSGFFPLRVVDALLAQGTLHRVKGAVETTRPAYVVYTADPKDPEVLDCALEGLRRIAAG